jgi:hypothetical protein
MLFVAGYRLGSHAGVSAWRAGFALVVVGAALVFAIMALGG